jgi:glycosyltransferase involved in cell wall biosynthesis/GT2 family glycosyltransferase
MSVSVIVPVLDGERYLAELLEALTREGPEEVLVIDSGSRDGSIRIARDAGVRLLEVPPAEFGHGRTRTLGVERTEGDLVCFLTQDATPCAGWLSAYREAFALDPRVGAAYGPHLPRPDTSPMIARELTEFFASMSPDGGAVLQGPGAITFLSNVNACYSRACLREIGFRDVPYSEDQAFGTDMLAAGWLKVYQPAAAVLHAHDYGVAQFMRRYFDEYRGLRDSIGHVEPLRLRGAAREVAEDLRWMTTRGFSADERARWAARSAVHHLGRRVAAPLGSRAASLPKPLRSRLSLEGRDDAAATTPPEDDIGLPLVGRHAEAWGGYTGEYAPVLRVWREGPARLLDPVPGMSERERLRLAMIIPQFRAGSGGHYLLLQILQRLERRGHICSLWVHDTARMHESEWPGVLRADLRAHFAPIAAPVYKGFDAWQGADVVIATGWQTVHPALLLDQCRARAYLVSDHEPEFFATSVEQTIAADTYHRGLHCIAGSRWLRDILRDRYGVDADHYDWGVDHEIYAPRPVARREDTVVYYARGSTPRRAVPIGLAALGELHRRRPQTRIVLFGDPTPVRTTFPYEHMGVLAPKQLPWLYSEATIGLCLSMTNISLMPKEMLACGLPCVELSGVSAESIFGADGPIELAPLDPDAIATAMERLLDDSQLRERRARDGIDFVAAHTWERATDLVEAGLRRSLALREQLWVA